jgi:hypothetical protein
MKISRIAVLFALVIGLSVVGAAQKDAVLVGAGDIASCDDLKGAEATAKLLDGIPGTVFAVGDLAYPDGSDEQFAKCYGPTWERSAVRRQTIEPASSLSVSRNEAFPSPTLLSGGGRSGSQDARFEVSISQ